MATQPAPAWSFLNCSSNQIPSAGMLTLGEILVRSIDQAGERHAEGFSGYMIPAHARRDILHRAAPHLIFCCSTAVFDPGVNFLEAKLIERDNCENEPADH
jgi:hypothetical protein